MNCKYNSRVPPELTDELIAMARAEGVKWQDSLRMCMFIGMQGLRNEGGLVACREKIERARKTCFYGVLVESRPAA